VEDIAVEELGDAPGDRLRGAPGQVDGAFRGPALDEAGELTEGGVAPGERLRPRHRAITFSRCAQRPALSSMRLTNSLQEFGQVRTLRWILNRVLLGLMASAPPAFKEARMSNVVRNYS
jgi:hypothetical protein